MFVCLFVCLFVWLVGWLVGCLLVCLCARQARARIECAHKLHDLFIAEDFEGMLFKSPSNASHLDSRAKCL